MALKRAESMALRPGGPLPCSTALKHSIVELTVTIDSENSVRVTLQLASLPDVGAVIVETFING